MDLSFVIVNWNTRGALLLCLESVFASLPESTAFEVFVVDNGSTDGSAAEVQRAYPHVILIENTKNLGFSRANNQALRLAQGRLVVLLNPDARLAPGALHCLVDFMTEHPDAAMAGGQLMNRDGSRQTSFDVFPSLWSELCNKTLMRILFPWRFPWKLRTTTEPVLADALVGACVVVRQAAIQQVGLMDEVFFLFFEETDWCLRMRKAGWGIYHVPAAKIFHAQGRSLAQDRKNALLEFTRSRYFYFRKHKSSSELVALRAVVWIKLLVKILWTAFAWVLTLGKMEEISRRLDVLLYLFGWHLKGCPRWVGMASTQAKPNLFTMADGRARISACLITRNEAHNVTDCLESLRFVAEIVVIDTFSTDKTPEICRRYTDKVFQAEWRGFSATKNLCVEQAENEWVLVIDADERVTPELCAEILDCKEEADGFYLPRQNYFLGRWIRHSGWYPDHTLRLFRKSAGKFADRAVHEAVDVQGKVGFLENPLVHYTYRDLCSYLARLNRYSTLAAGQILRDGTGRRSAIDLKGPLGRAKLLLDILVRPAITFVRMFIFQLGFLDGFYGFLLARNYSYYVLIKYAKVWEVLHSGAAIPQATALVQEPVPSESEKTLRV